jgi:hypothetical protein
MSSANNTHTDHSESLPQACCTLSAERQHPAPCGACMRAAQRRLQAHHAASIAAARPWQRKRAASGASAFS